MFKITRRFQSHLCFVNVIAKSSTHNAIYPTLTEFQKALLEPPESPPNSKVLKVAVLGMPNAGKSTLVNAFMNRVLLPTSCKIDTTVDNTGAVLTFDKTQIIFQDTPGVHARKKIKRLGVNQKRVGPSQCFGESDLGLVIGDLTSRKVKEGFLPPEILYTLLKNQHVPSVLVLTKEDVYSKKDNLFQLIYLHTLGKLNEKNFKPKSNPLVPMRVPKISSDDINMITDITRLVDVNDHIAINKLRHCHGWPHFKDVFVVSAKTMYNIPLLFDYIKEKAKRGAWVYSKDIGLTTSPEQCVLDFVRAQMLELLPQEVPYSVDLTISDWKTNEGALEVGLHMQTHRSHHRKLVIKNIRKILVGAQDHLHGIFHREVFLKGYCE